MSREQELVELVDGAGIAVGTDTVAASHTAPGRLHRAFSVLLRDEHGRLLLQQRAAAKTRFPLRWANACCGHPGPGEDVLKAASRRLAEELGVHGIDLREIGVHRYRADDPATGRVEHEYDHVLLGQVGSGIAVAPDPAEVAGLRWVDPGRIAESLPDAQRAPWLLGVVRTLLDSPA